MQQPQVLMRKVTLQWPSEWKAAGGSRMTRSAILQDARLRSLRAVQVALEKHQESRSRSDVHVESLGCYLWVCHHGRSLGPTAWHRRGGKLLLEEGSGHSGDCILFDASLTNAS